MTKCVNCTTHAIWEYVITPEVSQLYCYLHAPKGLKNNPNFKKYEEPVVEAPKTSKKKATAPVVEEPVVEEAPAEETPTEE